VLVVGREFEGLGNGVDLAVVAVELVELDGLGAVGVDEVENGLYLLLLERAVQPLNDLLELVDGQLATLVRVVSREGLVEGELLGGEYFEQLDETLLDLVLEFGGYLLSVEAFLLQRLSLLDCEVAGLRDQCLRVCGLVEGDEVLLHLRRQLLQRNRPVVVAVHTLEEELDFILGYFGMNMTQELGELLEVKLLQSFKAQSLQQPVQV
jgi:hypothetical protein